MTFFKRKVSSNTSRVVEVEVEEVYVAKTTIVSSYDDGTGCGPRCVTWCFLVKLEDGEYKELFSNRKLEKQEDTNRNGIVIADFDTPYIDNVEPLKEHLLDKNTEKMNIQLLFDFITNMNVLTSLGAFKDDEEE